MLTNDKFTAMTLKSSAREGAIIKNSMLINATLKDIEKHSDWIYTIALNPAKSGYPTYGNGIKTKADFIDATEKSITIYGMVSADETCQECVSRELLIASLNECKRMGAKFMTFFCGEEEKPILAELDFRCVSSYVLYIKTLISKTASSSANYS